LFSFNNRAVSTATVPKIKKKKSIIPIFLQKKC